MFRTHARTFQGILASMAFMALAGCSGSNEPTAKTGSLYDDLVSGIEYVTPTRQGVIGSDGKFTYLPGETVTFKIGNITLGKSVTGAETLTLFDLANTAQNADGSPSTEVVTMARLLQSLDSDGDPNNGITIAAQTRTALAGVSQTTLTATSDLNALLNTQAGLGVTIQTADVATDHLLSTVARVKGATTLARQTYSSGVFTEITKYSVDTSTYDVSYGNSTLPLAVGSSLRLKSSANGTLTFYGLTDRGPNSDSPAPVTDTNGTVYSSSKVFPVPGFVPKFVEITIKDGKTSVTKSTNLMADATTAMSGLPLPSGQTGTTGEIALNNTLSTSLGFSANGIDPEGLDIDADGKLWISDEYGPFIARVNPATGVVERKYIPGDATYPLPEMLKNRVPNRGMEGLAIADGLVYAIVQTPLDTDNDGKGDDTYLTLVELNPLTGAVNLYAVNYDKYSSSSNPNGFKASKVKAGDLMALGNGKFLMIEQGSSEAGLVNNLVLINISNATRLTSAQYTGKASLKAIVSGGTTITPASRTFIANLRNFGWLPEKAEGLAKVDDQTIAIINDSDFGIAPKALCTVGGTATTLDPTKLSLSLTTNTLSTSEAACDTGSISYSIVSNAVHERRTKLWLIKLTTPLSQL